MEFMIEASVAGMNKTWNVLVVEDDPILYPFLERVLQRTEARSRITYVATAEEAISELKEHDYDLILCDFYLAGLASGLDLWRVCQANRPRSAFVMMSGMPTDQFVRLFASSRCAPLFLKKPFHPLECQQVIRHAREDAPFGNPGY